VKTSKVWGSIAIVRREYGDGRRQARVIVKAPTAKRARELLEASPVVYKVSGYEWRTRWSEAGNELELAITKHHQEGVWCCSDVNGTRYAERYKLIAGKGPEQMTEQSAPNHQPDTAPAPSKPERSLVTRYLDLTLKRMHAQLRQQVRDAHEELGYAIKDLDKGSTNRIGRIQQAFQEAARINARIEELEEVEKLSIEDEKGRATVR
jgi:hypothetical protein